MAKRYRTKVELARAFNTSLPTIDKWTRDPECPGGRQGPWSHDAFEHFLGLKNSPIVGGATSQPRSKTAEMEATARALRSQEQYRKLKRENDAADKLLLSRDEVARDVAAWATQIRRSLWGLPDRVAAVVPGAMKATVKGLVQQAVRLVLREAFDAKVGGRTVEAMIIEEADRLRGPDDAE